MLCFTFREIPLEKTNLFKSEIIVRSMSYFLLMWQKLPCQAVFKVICTLVCAGINTYINTQGNVCFFFSEESDMQSVQKLSLRTSTEHSCIQRIETVFSIFITFGIHTTKLQIYNIPLRNMSKTIGLFTH